MCHARWRPCFLTNHKKRTTQREHCYQLIMKSKMYFQTRRIYYRYIGKNEPRQFAAMFFLTNHDKLVSFVRESPNNCFCKIILESGQWLIINDFLKVFPIGCHGNQSPAGISIILETTTQFIMKSKW